MTNEFLKYTNEIEPAGVLVNMQETLYDYDRGLQGAVLRMTRNQKFDTAILKDFLSGIASLSLTLLSDKTDEDFFHLSNRLAETLHQKNLDYGDSYTQSIEAWKEFGYINLGQRIHDKVSRLQNEGSYNVSEAVEDTLLDTAGYAVLALKYLEEHKNEKN